VGALDEARVDSEAHSAVVGRLREVVWAQLQAETGEGFPTESLPLCNSTPSRLNFVFVILTIVFYKAIVFYF
jgi:hypothetical protein